MGEFIKDIPEALRPYEKALAYGVEALDDAELLALVLRTGSSKEGILPLARRLLKDNGGRIGAIRYYSREELLGFEGIGPVKAVQIKALLELAVRLSRPDDKKADLSSPEKCASYFMEEMCGYDREVVKAIFLDSKSRFLRAMNISTGTVTQSMVPVREILLHALSARAVSLILMHNHPSGDPEPSEADYLATKRMEEAGKLVGIHLVDHLILGDHSYISLHERGWI